MGIMYQQRMDMISDDIWMDNPPGFFMGETRILLGISPVFNGLPKKPTEMASPAIYKTVSPVPNHHQSNLVSSNHIVKIEGPGAG